MLQPGLQFGKGVDVFGDVFQKTFTYVNWYIYLHELVDYPYKCLQYIGSTPRCWLVTVKYEEHLLDNSLTPDMFQGISRFSQKNVTVFVRFFWPLFFF